MKKQRFQGTPEKRNFREAMEAWIRFFWFFFRFVSFNFNEEENTKGD